MRCSAGVNKSNLVFNQSALVPSEDQGLNGAERRDETGARRFIHYHYQTTELFRLILSVD